MPVQRRLGGLPLAVYVVALLIVPLVAVGLFGMREIQRNDELAANTDELAEVVRVQTAAVGLIAPLHVERAASLGLARLHGFGIPTSSVPTLTGVDFDGIRSANGADLDDARSELGLAIAAAPERFGRFGSGLETALDDLETVVAALDDETAAYDDVDVAFDGVFVQLDLILDATDEAFDGLKFRSLDAGSIAQRVRVGGEVTTTAGNELSGLVSSVMDPEPAVSMDMAMMSGQIRHADALDAAEPDFPAEVATLRAEYDDLPYLDVSDFQVDDQASLLTPDVVGSLSSALIGRLDYLESVASFATTLGGDARAEMAALADATSRNNETTLIVFALVGGGSLLFGLIVLQSFARPLTRLRLQAEAIGRGELHARPLPLEGPSDVRKVTGAVNDMASTLALVDEHMKALAADQQLDDRALPELPGEVGASVRTSVERVTALTARLQMSESRLAEEARIDNLTSLPNRFAVLERIEDLLRLDGWEQKMIGVMFLDVDGFKSVNDTHGHAVGDVVLREIAQRLSGSVREIDYVARLGGDEFLVLVDNVSSDSMLYAFGERLIREIEQPYTIGDQLFAVSASVGVTVIEPNDDALSAIQRADAAVYQAKRRGRRRVEIFDKELQRSIEHQAELELALRQAIQHDELRVYMQPLADLSTGKVAGAEALVRWERPGVGLVPPGDFIPIAERSGLIFDLERWVLMAACARAAEWKLRGAGTGMRLAVNISGRHLIEGDLLGALDQAIAATGADPNYLEIELTESQLLDDVGRASSLLAAIRSRGIKVAIDDFGTGYSSMTYLQKLPVDIVKIDRSFISSATSNEFDSTIVESVVTIGRALDLEIVAEGIETLDQLRYVREAGVTFGQGFLLARPMPIQDAEVVLFNGPLFDVDRVAAVPSSFAPPNGAPVAIGDPPRERS